VKDRAFFFGSYEGYHLDAGQNIIEAVPSDLAWSRAVPAIQATRPAFTSGGAAVLPGASSDPLIDIVQLQDDQKVREHAFSGRFDLRLNPSWSFYTRVFHDQGTNDQPDGVTGRRKHFTDNPTNAVFNLQGLLGGWMIDEFKFGYNAAPSTYAGTTTATGFANSLISFCGTVANSGISGQGGTSSCATGGGLVRVNSQGNGVNAPYDPYSLTFADSLSRYRNQDALDAAKGTLLLGVTAVVAESFERIHRSNLVNMGVLPLQFQPLATAASLGLTGKERYELTGIASGLRPGGLITGAGCRRVDTRPARRIRLHPY
jgi:hypothetical protein